MNHLALLSSCVFFSVIVLTASVFDVAVQHILGVTVTHQDMEAIDPDYYKNLLQITTLPLEDLGLDLTFSADTEMFGASLLLELSIPRQGCQNWHESCVVVVLLFCDN